MPRKRSGRLPKYGPSHQRLRASWLPLVAVGDVVCARCGFLISSGARWDLGHNEFGGYLGPEHARCNRRAAARKGNLLRAARRRVVSREW